MPIDSSIYGQIQQPQIESPLNAMAKASQFRNMQNQEKLMNMQMQDATDARTAKNALAEAYRSAVDPTSGQVDRTKLLTSVASSGQGAQIPGIQKSFGDQDKATRDADKAKLESVKQHVELQGQLLGSVRDQNSWTQALQVAQQNGIDVSKFPPQYDPNMVRQLQQRALSAKEQVDQEWKAKNYDLDKQRVGISAANLGLSRERLNFDKGEAKGTGKPPAGYRWKADGSLEAITGGPADGGAKTAKTTEGEKAAAGYGLRMVEAEKIIDDIGTKNPNSQKPGILERIAGDSGFANLTRDNDRQQYRQAQEDWVRSKLRKESGAAIPSDEMDREIQTYFPQIGEKAGVIEQKRRARATATKAMGIAAGGAADQMNSGSAKSTNIDALLDKYK